MRVRCANTEENKGKGTSLSFEQSFESNCAVDPSVGFVPATLPYPVKQKEQPKGVSKSWYEKFKDTLTPAQKKAAQDTMNTNEQTVVQQVELKEQPAPKDEPKQEEPPADGPFPG